MGNYNSLLGETLEDAIADCMKHYYNACMRDGGKPPTPAEREEARAFYWGALKGDYTEDEPS